MPVTTDSAVTVGVMEMILNHNGSASLELIKDGPKICVIYRTVNDEAIVAKGTGVSNCLAAIAADVGGFSLNWDYPEELDLEQDPLEQPSVMLSKHDLPLDEEEAFDHKAGGDGDDS